VAQCDLNLSYQDKGLLNGAAFLGIVLSSHFWGFLSDTWGRRQVLRLSLSSAVVISIVSSFSTTAWMLIITRFLVGVW
jgi:MFS transporter, VNT family, synaptic vesicle glycoprotein 2